MWIEDEFGKVWYDFSDSGKKGRPYYTQMPV